MARYDSLNVLLTTGGKDKLAEDYGKVIANVMARMSSSNMKNTDLSGAPTAGSFEAKRLVNRTSNVYGTARSGGKGQSVTAKPVTVLIDQDRELITEIEEKDVALYGVDAFIAKTQAQDENAMILELERAFYTEAVAAGTELTLAGTDAAAKAEELIQAVETVKNDFVDGVDRTLIHLVCSPSFYGQLRTYIDKVNDGGATAEEINLFHGVKVYSSVYLPTGKSAVVMAQGSVTQPVLPTVCAPERVPLSNAIATGLFYSYGTKAVAEDLIFYA